MPLGIDPTVDYVFKRLFGDPQNSDLLIHLLNAVLELNEPIEFVEILNPFLEKEFNDDKLAVLDIKACDRDRHWLNVEIQTSIFGGLKERLVYYTSCLFAEQFGEGDSYGELLPTISICFLTRSLFGKTPIGHLRFVLTDAVHQIQLTDRFQVHTVEMLKYDVTQKDLTEALPLEKWVFFIRRAAELEPAELIRLLPDPAFVKATGVLEMISRTPEERLRYDQRQKAIRDRFSELEYNRMIAREEGREEGRELGREEGERIATIRLLHILQNLAKVSITSESEIKGLSNAELADRIEQVQRQLGSSSTN